MNTKRTLRIIASHCFAVAIFTNPYILLVIADIYHIATNDQSEVAVYDSLIAVMSAISFVAFIVAVALALYASNKKGKIFITAAMLLLLLSWWASYIFVPLGLVVFLAGLAILVYYRAQK